MLFAFVSSGVGHRKSQVSPQHEGPFSQSVQLELERLHPVKVKLLPPSWLVQQCERVSLTKYLVFLPTAVAPDLEKSITMTCGWQNITSPRSAATHRRCVVCAGHRMEDTSPAEAMTTWCAFGRVCRRAAWATTTCPSAAGVNIKAPSRLRLLLVRRSGLFKSLVFYMFWEVKSVFSLKIPSRLWLGVHGSRTSWLLEAALAIAASAFGTSTVAPASAP